MIHMEFKHTPCICVCAVQASLSGPARFAESIAYERRVLSRQSLLEPSSSRDYMQPWLCSIQGN